MTNQSAELREAIAQAIVLIDEINERSASRVFFGINQVLHAKLATIRATLMRATKKHVLPPQGTEHSRAIEGAVRVAVWNAAKDRGMGDEPAYALIRKVIADPAIRALAPEAKGDGL